MKSKQVLDVQQMQHLQELGLDTSNASMLYCDLYDNEYILVESKHRFDKEENAILLEGVRNSVIYCKKATPSYTLQDVLDALPKDISKDGCTWYASLYIDFENNRIAYGNTDRYGFEIYHEIIIEKDLIDAAYSMLCWAIENKFVKTDKNKLE